MKVFTFLFSIIFYLFCNCQKQKQNKTMDLKEYKYKNTTRPVYVLGLNIPGPHEVYVNDILIHFENETSMHNYGADINPYILKSGTYPFRVRVYPTIGEENGIEPETAKFIRVTLDTAERNLTGDGGTRTLPDTYKVLQEFVVPKIDKPVPFLDITGTLKIDVPYDLEGWSKGQDLRKMDQKVLQEKVVAYYQKLWTVLNDGKGQEYLNLWKKSDEELSVFNYEKHINNEVEKINKAKGRMALLEDYSMKIYGDGKLVTLERDNHTEEINGKKIDLKGKSPLYRLALYDGIGSYPVKLYLPQGSNDFIIIRK